MNEFEVVIPDKQGTFDFGYFEGGASLCLPLEDRFPHVAAETGDGTAPRIRGTLADYVSATAAARPAVAARLQRMAWNRVRRCACGKCVAATLAACNGCGAPLAGVPVTRTENVFAGFVLGVERCAHFALTISARAQTPRTLVFDDPLALAPCHLNAVPAQDYVADWRGLLRRPAAGLALVRELRAHCDRVAREQFLADRAWRAKALRADADADAVLAAALAGFNLPPSQFQLHLQYILPPLLPQQHRMLRAGLHFTKGRFVPYEYVEAVLDAAAKDPHLLDGLHLCDGGEDQEEEEDKMPSLDVIVAHFAQGPAHIDYNTYHAALLARAEEAQRRFANWDPADFGGFLAGSTLHRFTRVEARPDGTFVCHADAGTPADVRALVAADKKTLQNYGRPYSPETGNPTGTYYRFPKDPEEINIW